MEKINLAVIAGGWSGEKDVSLMSGKAVINALDKDKYNVTLYDPCDGLQDLYKDRDMIDLAIILLHGKIGEDGRIQGFLDIVGIPFLGSGTLASSVCFHKVIAKDLLKSAGLRVIKDIRLDRSAQFLLDEIVDNLGPSTVVKPVAEGSSIGISICHDKEALARGIDRAFQYDKEVIVEQFIRGREVTCCVIGNEELEFLPIIEIIPDKKYDFFDYEAKYTPGASKEVCPAPLNRDMRERVYKCARMAHKVLKCHDWSRTDMIINGEKVFFLETNTIPGMTETSLVPLAAKKAGLSLSQFLDKLIGISIDRSGHGIGVKIKSL